MVSIEREKMSELNQQELDAIVSYWQTRLMKTEQHSLLLELKVARLESVIADLEETLEVGSPVSEFVPIISGEDQ
jgi:hypothetical protein